MQRERIYQPRRKRILVLRIQPQGVELQRRRIEVSIRLRVNVTDNGVLQRAAATGYWDKSGTATRIGFEKEG